MLYCVCSRPPVPPAIDAERLCLNARYLYMASTDTPLLQCLLGIVYARDFRGSFDWVGTRVLYISCAYVKREPHQLKVFEARKLIVFDCIPNAYNGRDGDASSRELT